MKTFLLAVLVLASFPAFAADETETALERIQRTGVIRCGYYVFPPITYRDPNTKELSGFSVDMMNEVAKQAGLKVEWTEEFTFGNWVPAIQSRRFDVACTPMWPSLPMAKAVAFTHSMFFSGLYPVALKSNARFNENMPLAALNKPEVTISAQEGNATYDIVKEAFPDAKIYALPPEADTASYYTTLTSKKADITLTDHNGVIQYNKAHPKEQVKLVATSEPVKLQSFPLAVLNGEQDLLNFMNLAIDEMHYDGKMSRILAKWETVPGQYLRVAKPYK